MSLYDDYEPDPRYFDDEPPSTPTVWEQLDIAVQAAAKAIKERDALRSDLAAAQAEARELRQSRREAIDMANDNAVLAADALRERDELRKESERLEAENQQLLSTFRHSHHRSDNGDSCAQCGLDLRHPIHNRTLASRGDK